MFPRLFGEVVLFDGLHHIRGGPTVTGQHILQGEGPVSRPSDCFAHSRAAQLQSYLMHNLTQILLIFIQTPHLFGNRKK